MTNSGSVSAVIGKVTIALPFRITSDSCSGRTIAKGRKCGVAVDFAPTAAGAYSYTLSIPYNGTAPAKILLTGTGVAAVNTHPGVAE